MHKQFQSENLKRRPSLGRHRRKWEDIIKLYLEEIDCESVDWM
jgi:hypothetical protein